jgi:hypothetical protein
MRTFLFVALVTAAVVVGSKASADGPQALTPVDTYTVASGETLWEIASSLASPGESTRSLVGRIIDLNGMESAAIDAGDQILIPVTP